MPILAFRKALQRLIRVIVSRVGLVDGRDLEMSVVKRQKMRSNELSVITRMVPCAGASTSAVYMGRMSHTVNQDHNIYVIF